MHYYKHHIGDFIRDTSRLSDEQCMAYMRIIWTYYESEQPLPNNPRALAFRIGASEEVVSLILDVFFKLEDGVWRHTRCDSEIAEYKAICNRNKTNGKAGGRPKKTQSVSSEIPVGTQSEPSRNPNQEPITNNQESKSKSSCDQQAGSRERIDYESVFEAYARNLPKLPQVRIKDDARKRAIKTIIGMDKKFAEPDFFDRYFAYVEKSDFLMGRNERAWKGCCFDWLMKPANLKKIIEGNYHHA